MWSQPSNLTVVWFYLSWRGVISLSSQYWNLVLRTGQSFPAVITSICGSNTCVPAIKISKTLQTPHAPFRLGSRYADVSPAFRLLGICLAAGCCCVGRSGWGVVVFVLRLQWQIECRHSPLALKTVVICYIIRTSQVSAHSSVFAFNPFHLFVLASTSNIQV